MHPATVGMSCSNCQVLSGDASSGNTFSSTTFIQSSFAYAGRFPHGLHYCRVSPSERHCCHTRYALWGMFMCVTPRCANASTMADVKQGIDPTCGDSATPLAPIG